MHLCAVSFKECWQDEAGAWYSDGGFPLQMAAIASLFDDATILVTRRETPGAGGLPLPPQARVVPIRRPAGKDMRRKASVLAHLPYYLWIIGSHVRRADVVHVPPPGDIPFIGMLVALGFRKRLIVRYCGSWATTARTTTMNRVTRALMRICAGGRNVMLATGEADHPPAPGVHWIFATALTRNELQVTVPVRRAGLSNPPRLAFVGRLDPVKGLSNLVEAVGILAKQGHRPLPQIVLVGDGPQRLELRSRMDALRCQRLFRFTGQLDRCALADVLAEADLCVQPSLSEGFSKAWLDAFAHGLPVLGTEVGAACRVIGRDGERGWLVPPGDAAALAARIRQVLTEPQDWSAMRRRCRAYAEDHTLEAWTHEIGRICAEQWGMRLVDGRLRS